ncbi:MULTISPECIES: Lrp/AsnC family transcriptional regulator [unclassified Variovorax]|uniref:Lrp/AsnC family transcriptional regulator n=1 Tax=unclassified Variovorax TaxID=663243 RepID=UPI002576A0E1|nr:MULTISPECIES: Lrp/AsnC family transcriptional regulator [unclassified Variovorax]MDM0088317.1 Lrp/AsnC family transcriptional regulator [Variovorax sp. J22G40]MDM0146390.1 Lrp/AsnC family transcriptional regulator [Variovorax sp. J2P1-31]
MTPKLDNYDRVLLAAIQEDGRMPQSELGARANLSTAAVNRRLRLLSEAGVIEGYTARIHPKAVGYGLTVVVEVKVESERADLLDEMRHGFEACPQIQQCYYVTGECDFVLIFLVRDMDQYVELTRRLFHGNNNVKAFRTLVVMDRVKTGAKVNIEAA